MKFKTIALLFACSVIIFSSCSKEGTEKLEVTFGDEEAEIVLRLGYTSNIASAIETNPDYPYITTGVIEYSQNGNLIATLDYGDGTKDAWARLLENGNYSDIDLSGKKKDTKYTKVITSPLIKIEGCDYIVAGIIKYYEGENWVATVDYGIGDCDEWALKSWKDGNETFSLKK
jgi:hypothetical protein